MILKQIQLKSLIYFYDTNYDNADIYKTEC